MKRVSSQTFLIIVMLTLRASLCADEFQPHVHFDGQLFPSFIISSAGLKPHAGSPVRFLGSINARPATSADNPEPEAEPGSAAAPIVPPTLIGDQNGLIGVEILASRANLPVTVTISCDEVMEPSTFSGKLEEEGTTYFVAPRIRFKYSKLAEVNQATPVSMHFKVRIGGKSSEDTRTVMLRSINDCPLVTIEYGAILDTSSTFAAYVNEQHPFLDKLLREALDIGVVDSFSGYQTSEEEVLRQVYSIWDALVTRDVRYSSITATSSSKESVACQHVRLIEESLNNSQANCVDGSVLMASALRKIGIEPFLILVPGHCYVGFFTDKDNKVPLAIETTLLGDSSDDEAPTGLELLESAIDEEHRFEDSWPGFKKAIAVGTQNLMNDREKFSSPDEQSYLLISIANARDRGIMPIAFRGKEEFVGNGLVWNEEEESDEETIPEEESEEGDSVDDEDENEEDENEEDENEDDENEDDENEDDENEDDENEDDEEMVNP